MIAARGEYIAFLDSDDVYLPERLNRHMAAFTSHAPIDVIISGELYWWSWNPSHRGDHGPVNDRDFVPPVTPLRPFVPPDLLCIMLEAGGAATPSICSISFRRSLAMEFGGVPERSRESTRIRRSSDCCCCTVGRSSSTSVLQSTDSTRCH